MNGLKEAVILGIIQGATEFLPISSSGHLVLVSALFNLKIPNLSFTLGLHAGTLLSLIVYFYREVIGLLKGFITVFKQKKTEEEKFYQRLLLMIIIAVIPAGIAGVLFSKRVDLLFQDPKKVSYLFFITAAFLVLASILSNKNKRTLKDINQIDAIIVGIFQIFALPPGISRSGSTITGGIISGLDKDSASKFSFLIAIPVILGATLLEVRGNVLGTFTLLDLLIGILVSFIAGLISLWIFFPLIKKTNFYVFAGYCIFIGLFGLIFIK
ncbi:MAG: undecaprenyl-diphosphate phosphatase [Caldisericum sp.]